MIGAPMCHRAVLFLSLAASALAQEAVPPNRFVPASAQVVLRYKAPVLWHEQFAKTRLAKLFEGPTLAPIVKQARERYPEALDRAAAAGMPREVLKALIEDYRGELLVSLQFDFVGVAADPDRKSPDFAVMLAMAPDGKFDLAALQAGLRKVDDEADTATSALQVGEHTFRVAKQRTPLTQPELVDGHLVMFYGTAIEKLGPGMLARTNRGERLPPDAPFALHLDIAGTTDAIVAAVTEHRPDPDAPATPQQILDSLGFSNLDAFDAALGAAGEHVALETNLSTRGRAGGLLDLWFVDAKRPSLLRCVPPSVGSFSVSALDLRACARAITALLELGAGKEGVAEMEAAFFEKTKCRLNEDLLDHLGSELMLLGDLRGALALAAEVERDGSQPDPNRMFSDYCLGLSLRDGKAFAASIDRMLRATGLHAARKTEQYRGARIHELRLGGALIVEYSITDDLALVVLGSRGNGRDFLRAALDAHGDGKPTLPDALAKKIDGLPDGWSGIGSMPLVDLVLAIAELGTMRAERQDQLSREMLDSMRAAGRELKALGLGDAVSVSYSGKRGLRTIYRW
jgi:hypothetical protein